MSPDRPATQPTDEITPAMIAAGARVLLNDPFFDLSPTIAELIAEDVLRCGALAARCENDPNHCARPSSE
jgi:hypothetical protein